MRRQTFNMLVICFVAAACLGCQGKPSEMPPIHPNPNMDDQPKYRPQDASAFFDNGAAMRMPIEGTVARGNLRTDGKYFHGKDENGNFVVKAPMKVDADFIRFGKKRYDIFCSPCHAYTGKGQGLVVQKGYPPATDLHDPRLISETDGHLYDVVSNGIRNMPGYKAQIPVRDRWAIVTYMRALQRAFKGTKSDVPMAEIAKLDNGDKP